MKCEYVTVYDQDMTMLGVLENADEIGYNLPLNDLWTASFSLPAKDPKNAFCGAFNYVSIPDGARDVGLYRLIGMPDSEEVAAEGRRTYSLEHVMATLLEDILFGYNEIGGTNVSTRQVMAYILQRQEVKRWVLGECDFTQYFTYKFENAYLLQALLSLGNVLTEPYTWVFDTSATPWTVSLKRAETAAGCGIHYMRNMVGVTKTMDATPTVTRLYPLGYGEGVNQLTIRSVNGGVPYIEADTAGRWGVKSAPFSDPRIEDAATLKARAQAVLEQYKNPYITYTASAIDLGRYTGQSWDMAMPGKQVRVLDGEHGLDFTARVTGIAKSGTRGENAGEIEITIANAPRDAADEMNSLADRVGIGELYSQGATNLYPVSYSDNADAAHPARMKVYVPGGCVRINQVALSWELDAFRAYETGADAGGATTQTSQTSGGGSQTSEEGGDAVLTIPRKIYASDVRLGGPIDANGDPVSATGMNTQGTSTNSQSGTITGGADPASSSSGGSHRHEYTHKHRYTGASEYTGTGLTTGGSGSNDTDSGGSHSHGIGHTHSMGHSHGIPGHQHTMYHYHGGSVAITIPAMDIEISGHRHSVNIPAHSHSLTIPAHTHPMQYGIYEGEKAGKITLRVDGVNAGTYTGTSGELEDITQYLAKDAQGRITRGDWHVIELVPDGQTHINASLCMQTFVQSVGGGDY